MGLPVFSQQTKQQLIDFEAISYKTAILVGK